MKKKSIFVCEECFSRNYSYYLSTDREKTLKLRKYCVSCKGSTYHNESK